MEVWEEVREGGRMEDRSRVRKMGGKEKEWNEGGGGGGGGIEGGK